MPGVSLQINNGRGEDQFLTIRGLNPDYDTTTVDGMALASTEETTRWVSLDVIPSVVVKGVDVDKTWRVDQPSDAVGGIADLHTRSAFDHPGQFFDAHADAAYWEDTEQVHSKLPSGNLDATYSNTFGPSDEFGVLVPPAISNARRRREHLHAALVLLPHERHRFGHFDARRQRSTTAPRPARR